MIAQKLLGLALVFSGVMFYLVIAKKQTNPFLSKCLAAFGGILVLAGVVLSIPRESKSLVVWTPYAPGVLETAAAEGKPVALDFYADWCVPCHQLEHSTYSDPKVAEALNSFVRVKADATDMRRPEIEDLIERFEVEGLPTLLFLDGKGKEIREARIFGFVSPLEMLITLNSPAMGARLHPVPEEKTP